MTELTTDIDWAPIEPLDRRDLEIDVAEFDSVARVWADARKTLDQENPSGLEEFTERLRRSWSIETGILERLYILDRGTTLTLIDRGFHQELVNRADTDIDPGRLVAILKDHLGASEMIQGFIKDDRPLSAHFIRELQALVTRHQESVEAIDTLGNPVRVEPIRGQWKIQPNWTDLASGQRRHFCPPEHVEGQIHDLLEYLHLHENDGVNSCLLAAWFHHRFTVIHPFQDGNGRVARALVNYFFVRAGLFPVVIDRTEHAEYVDALESASAGNLAPFVTLLATKQISAIKQALSLTTAATPPEQRPIVRQLAKGIVDRVRRREAQEQEQFRRVNDVLIPLWEFGIKQIQTELDDFRMELEHGGLQTPTDVDSGGTHDGREYFYRRQIIETAQEVQQWANFNEEARWIRGLVRGGITQLRVVFSFHHVGRSLTGVAEVTAFADLEDLNAQPAEEGPGTLRTSIRCMLQPFSVTWRDDPEQLYNRFAEWCRNSLLVALREWADRL
ncbi:MAG: filamentation induced by cAMP protein Fic [Chloroflexi bacterium]|nr:filamentation induced by cAMP protein Fic [Chloroflexota bacterium]